MWMLIRKDLILDRRTVGLNLALYLIMGPAFIAVLSEAPVKAVAVWAGLVGAMIPLSLVSREDKFRSAALTCSLPVTRDAVVSARYWGGGLVTLAAIAVILAAGYLVPQTGLAERGLGTGPLLAAFTVAGLVQAALLPFTIRFGIAGLMVFLVGAQVVGMGAFLSGMLVGYDALRGLIRTISLALAAVRAAAGEGGLAVVLVTAVLLLNLVSLALARRLFRAREL
jgi:ABC-type transport system involved in multi-copper enzyme maturation permease subunit